MPDCNVGRWLCARKNVMGEWPFDIYQVVFLPEFGSIHCDGMLLVWYWVADSNSCSLAIYPVVERNMDGVFPAGICCSSVFSVYHFIHSCTDARFSANRSFFRRICSFDGLGLCHRHPQESHSKIRSPTRRSIQPLGAALFTSIYDNYNLNPAFDVRPRS